MLSSAGKMTLHCCDTSWVALASSALDTYDLLRSSSVVDCVLIGFGIERIDPLHFPAGSCKVVETKPGSVLALSLGFF